MGPISNIETYVPSLAPLLCSGCGIYFPAFEKQGISMNCKDCRLKKSRVYRQKAFGNAGNRTGWKENSFRFGKPHKD